MLNNIILSEDMKITYDNIDFSKRRKLQTNLEKKIDKNTLKYIKLMRILTLWREERKRILQMISVVISKILKQISKENNMDYKSLTWIIPEEFEKLKKDSSYSKQRPDGCVFYIRKEATKHSLIYGDEAKIIIEEFNEKNQTREIQGMTACAGKVIGRVRIVQREHQFYKFEKGEILVTTMTRPEYIPLLKMTSAIITDEGGLTCHAAIVSRELNKPCIIGTKVATQVLNDGDMVEVDADNGIVRKINDLENKNMSLDHNQDLFKRFREKTSNHNIASQEGTFSLAIMGGFFPGAFKEYMNKLYDFDFGAFIFFVEGKHGTLFFDESNYANTTRTAFNRFKNIKNFKDLKEFDKISKKIFNNYSRNKDISSWNYNKVLIELENSYKLLCKFIVSTVFSEALGKELIKELYNNNKLENNKFEEFYEMSNKICFESFTTRFDNALLNHKTRDATWTITTYHGAPEVSNVDKLIEQSIKDKGGSKLLLNEIRDQQALLKETRKEVINYKKTLSKNSLRLFEFIQLCIRFRDERKDALNRVNTTIARLIEKFFELQKYPKELVPYFTYYDILDKTYLNKDFIKMLKQRLNGVALYGDGDMHVFVEEYKSLKKQFYDSVDSQTQKEITGMSANKGIIKGTARIILSEKDFNKFQNKDIIIASMTRVEYVPLMKKCSGIITDEGGITCHAAIISRELKIPCIIGTKNATRKLKDGDYIELDANHGIIKCINKNMP